MKKVFNVKGDLVVRFAADSKKQITKWLDGVDYDYAVKFAKKVNNDSVFGKALDFPCISEGVVESTKLMDMMPADKSNKIKSALKKYLAKFPDDAKSWKQATDEVREIAYMARELIGDIEDKKIQPLNFRLMPTPSDWNTRGKEFIFKVYDMMNAETKTAFADYLKDNEYID